ncbi:calcium-binding protein [Escherichia coli]
MVVWRFRGPVYWYSWVHDKGDESRERPVFIIGNDGNNLLAGGQGGDYIEGAGGNDKIEPGKGANRVDGGSGYDTLLLSDVMDDWNIYRVSDGTLFFHSERGAGLTEATGIEGISFSGDWRSKLSPYQIEEEQITDHRYLLKWRNKNV